MMCIIITNSNLGDKYEKLHLSCWWTLHLIKKMDFVFYFIEVTKVAVPFFSIYIFVDYTAASQTVPHLNEP